MKTTKFLFILTLVAAFASKGNAQTNKLPEDKDTKLITYSEVVNSEGVSGDLFNRCIEWVNSFYKNPTAVTTKREKENGLIEGKHQFQIFNADKDGKIDKNVVAFTIMYSFTINFKDGRYKYTVSNFKIKSQSAYPLEKWNTDPTHDFHLKQVADYMKDWQEKLKATMVKKAEKKAEQW